MKAPIKQAIVLAGGQSSRFVPYSQDCSKLAIELMGRSVIEWTLLSLAGAEIDEIIVVMGQETHQLKKEIADFNQTHPGLSVQSVIQQQPNGMADAILTAKELLTDRFLVVNGSQFNAGRLVSQLNMINSPVILSCQATEQPWLYGIVETKGDRAISLKEKPTDSSVPAQRVVSAYVLTKKFINFMSGKASDQYLLETALNAWMQTEVVKLNRVKKDFPSLKYSWHLLDLKNLLFNHIDFGISNQAQIAESAVIKGDVYVGDNALIGEFAEVRGPVYIGAGSVVGRYCVIRKESVLEQQAEIQSYTDLNDSLIMSGAHVHSGFIGNSVIGKQARIGANFITANRRLDRGEIKPTVKGKEVNTKRTRLGAIVGHQAKIGINVGTMPGVIIDSTARVYPGETIFENYLT